MLLALLVSVCLVSLVAKTAAAAPTRRDPDLRGAWFFDEGTGDIAGDRSMYGNDRTIEGATWTKGRVGTGLFFDGVNDRVRVPRSASLEPEHVSLSLWFRTSTPSGSYRVLACKGVIDCASSFYSWKSDASGAGITFMSRDGHSNIWTPVATGVWGWTLAQRRGDPRRLGPAHPP
jgi:hypothetical protein